MIHLGNKDLLKTWSLGDQCQEWGCCPQTNTNQTFMELTVWKHPQGVHSGRRDSSVHGYKVLLSQLTWSCTWFSAYTSSVNFCIYLLHYYMSYSTSTYVYYTGHHNMTLKRITIININRDQSSNIVFQISSVILCESSSFARMLSRYLLHCKSWEQCHSSRRVFCLEQNSNQNRGSQWQAVASEMLCLTNDFPGLGTTSQPSKADWGSGQKERDANKGRDQL